MGDEVAYVEADYIRGFSGAQIVAHVQEALGLLGEINPPDDLRVAAFQVAQQMLAIRQPRPLKDAKRGLVAL